MSLSFLKALLTEIRQQLYLVLGHNTLPVNSPIADAIPSVGQCPSSLLGHLTHNLSLLHPPKDSLLGDLTHGLSLHPLKDHLLHPPTILPQATI